MEISLEGLIPNDVAEAAQRGEIFRHLVCGLDIYLTPDEARASNDKIEPSRMYSGGRYFSRHYLRIIDLADQDDDPFPFYSSVIDLTRALFQNHVGGVSTLRHDVVEIDEGDSIYVLVPLTDKEMEEFLFTCREIDIANPVPGAGTR